MAQKSEPKPGRRQVLQVLAGSVGAGLAAPALATGEAHAHGSAGSAAAQATGAATAPLPTLLDENELAMLRSLAETIVPGSSEAGVAAFVDQLLAVDTRERQRDFLAALGAIQSEALSRYGKSWMSLDAAQQTELLTAASTGPRSREPRYWKPGEPVLVPEGPRKPPTLRDRFELLKDRIASAYYSSEKGMKELGWTGQMVHPAYPGCTHPDGHATGD
jgi:gluconate 2-dehydrogenase subunit 3-like protein